MKEEDSASHGIYEGGMSLDWFSKRYPVSLIQDSLGDHVGSHTVLAHPHPDAPEWFRGVARRPAHPATGQAPQNCDFAVHVQGLYLVLLESVIRRHAVHSQKHPAFVPVIIIKRFGYVCE